MDSKKIILNQIQTPDGTILTSRYRHDYVEYQDKNGEYYMVDGGTDYLRRSSGHKQPFTELSIYEDAPFEVIRQHLCRGGRGKDGMQPLTWVPLYQMSNEWLINCLDYNHKLGLRKSLSSKMYVKELWYRRQHKIIIND